MPALGMYVVIGKRFVTNDCRKTRIDLNLEGHKEEISKFKARRREIIKSGAGILSSISFFCSENI